MEAESIYQSLGLQRDLKAPEEESRSSLGQAQFLKLLTTQLEHQDPTEPVDNKEFLGQMAQFASLSGIENLQKSFENFASNMKSSQAVEASSLIGRSVFVSGENSYFDGTNNVKGVAELANSAGDLTMVIEDSVGQQVNKMSFGVQPSGPFDFSWDGTNDAGNKVPPGKYTIRLMESNNGESSAVPTLLQESVKSVVINGAKGLLLNFQSGSSSSLANVRQML